MNVLHDFPALVAVADELHFGRAALRLGMSQPQLSTVIRRLEHRSGAALFTRRPKVVPTPEGAALIAAARRAVQEAESGMAAARAIADGLSGTVRLGFAPVSILSGLASALGAFRAAHPDLRLELVERHSASLWEDLKRDRLDLIVARQIPDDPGFEGVELLRHPMMVAVPESHALVKTDEVTLEALRDETFVFWARESAPHYYDLVFQACHAAGFDPQISQTVSGWSSMLALVAAGFGIALVSAPLGDIGFPGVRFVAMGEPVPKASFWLGWRRGGENTAARSLRSVLEAHLRLQTDT